MEEIERRSTIQAQTLGDDRYHLELAWGGWSTDEFLRCCSKDSELFYPVTGEQIRTIEKLFQLDKYLGTGIPPEDVVTPEVLTQLIEHHIAQDIEITKDSYASFLQAHGVNSDSDPCRHILVRLQASNITSLIGDLDSWISLSWQEAAKTTIDDISTYFSKLVLKVGNEESEVNFGKFSLPERLRASNNDLDGIEFRIDLLAEAVDFFGHEGIINVDVIKAKPEVKDKLVKKIAKKLNKSIGRGYTVSLNGTPIPKPRKKAKQPYKKLPPIGIKSDWKSSARYELVADTITKLRETPWQQITISKNGFQLLDKNKRSIDNGEFDCTRTECYLIAFALLFNIELDKNNSFAEILCESIVTQYNSKEIVWTAEDLKSAFSRSAHVAVGILEMGPENWKPKFKMLTGLPGIDPPDPTFFDQYQYDQGTLATTYQSVLDNFKSGSGLYCLILVDLETKLSTTFGLITTSDYLEWILRSTNNSNSNTLTVGIPVKVEKFKEPNGSLTPHLLLSGEAVWYYYDAVRTMTVGFDWNELLGLGITEKALDPHVKPEVLPKQSNHVEYKRITEDDHSPLMIELPDLSTFDIDGVELEVSPGRRSIQVLFDKGISQDLPCHIINRNNQFFVNISDPNKSSSIGPFDTYQDAFLVLSGFAAGQIDLELPVWVQDFIPNPNKQIFINLSDYQQHWIETNGIRAFTLATLDTWLGKKYKPKLDDYIDSLMFLEDPTEVHKYLANLRLIDTKGNIQDGDIPTAGAKHKGIVVSDDSPSGKPDLVKPIITVQSLTVPFWTSVDWLNSKNLPRGGFILQRAQSPISCFVRWARTHPRSNNRRNRVSY